jgi:hypothetical protein
MEKYNSYKCINFLNDDSFIKSQSGISSESDFWFGMVERNEVNIDEYLEAGRIVELWQNAQPDIDDDRIEKLGDRIFASIRTSSTPQRKPIAHNIRRIAVAILAVAAAIALFFGIKYLNINKIQPVETPDYAGYNLLYQQQPKNDIVIISEDSELKIEEKNPELKYDDKGTLTVNNREVKAETPIAAEQKNPAATPLNRLYVPFGKSAQLTLSDGSRLWVNTGTEVIYPEKFNDDVREIYVNGEIYAKVQHIDNKPFVIKTNGMEIKVLGTEFNFSAYEKDNVRQVVLVNGSVSVLCDENELIMTPSQAFTATDKGVSLKNVDTSLYTSWKDGIYIFNEAPIEDVLFKLARYYNVTVLLPQQLSETAFCGKLELKDNFDTIMHSLAEVARFNYTVKDGTYVVVERTR